MGVIHAGRLVTNPTDQMIHETLEAVRQLLAHLSGSQEIHVGTSPPPGPWSEGDIWYDPVENRYLGYVEG